MSGAVSGYDPPEANSEIKIQEPTVYLGNAITSVGGRGGEAKGEVVNDGGVIKPPLGGDQSSFPWANGIK